MQINRIRIENYRSIKTLDICPSDMMALVGPNNTGKTNILSALNVLLGDRWPTRQGLESKDWFNQDTSQDILIRVWFEENSNNIESVWFRCPGEEGRVETRYTQRLGYTSSQWLSSEVRDKCALVYLDAGRNFDMQFGQSRWSLFGRIIRQLDDDFRTQIPSDTRRQLEHHLTEAQRLLKTPLYECFEAAIQEAFLDQLKQTTHQIRFDFRTFDPLNFYRSLQPVLIEDGIDKNPGEAGSGMRNLIVLALFRAYAKSFRGQALIAIEEPEIYLHPHAQRSLARLFEELANNGSQLFFSTHSAAFIDIARSDRLALVDRFRDAEGDMCTHVRTRSTDELVADRQYLYPTLPMTQESVRARYRNICSLEHAEAFFAQAILLVEGPTEMEAFPIFSRACGIDFDALNISVVSANGKGNLDALYQLYEGHGIPVFLVFDNDRGGKHEDIKPNCILTRLIGLNEIEMPNPTLTDRYCILEKNFESMLSHELEAIDPEHYATLQKEASDLLGPRPGKPIVARYMATELQARGIVPPTFRKIAEAVAQLANPQLTVSEESLSSDISEVDIPF